MSQKITPFLWFNDQAEEAMNFYVATFKNSRVLSVQRAGPDAKAFHCTFELDGVQYHALNGGPYFSLSPAFSLFVECDDQAEVDQLWDRLLEGGGQPSRCGWLTDRFGLSWQLIPRGFGALLGDPDPVKAGRVREAMMKMVKLDLATLQRAHAGE